MRDCQRKESVCCVADILDLRKKASAPVSHSYVGKEVEKEGHCTIYPGKKVYLGPHQRRVVPLSAGSRARQHEGHEVVYAFPMSFSVTLQSMSSISEVIRGVPSASAV